MINHHLVTTKNNYPNIKIDISIPTFYSQLNGLTKYVNKLYIMAYKNPTALIARISKFPKSSFIAQNCPEFSSKKMLKNTFLKIEKNGYKNIAYHDYKTCKNLLSDF